MSSNIISVKTSNMETNIYYSLSGNGEETLVIIPGNIGASNIEFSYLIQNVPDHLRIVTFHLRGLGRSKPPQTREYPLDFYYKDADDCAAIMESLSFEKYSVLGFCDGGLSAMILAAKYPTRVQKLILLSTCAYSTEKEFDVLNQFKNIDADCNPKILKDYLKVYGDRATVQQCYSNYLNTLSALLRNAQGLCQSELSKIQSPTLILHGENDGSISVTQAHYLRENIPRSQLYIIPDGRHFIHHQFPDKFVKFL
ncbi:Valacyclovir hydrolase [Trichoplax sp. H2]|nr:Valacyclovir hydrolase [Trichoplax sp. H2]|eukprot:RDD36032.1 Valacyclovir hydrolase [Trichoplax sp. H2]